MKKYLQIILLFIISFTLLWLLQYSLAGADTNIDATDHWAWSDTAGWWDFYSTNTVDVQAPELHGYASSSIGEMALNCDSTPKGNVCGTSDFAVTNSQADGQLSGCAWNDTIGWISFNCADYDCQGGDICAESEYKVTIDANGNFQGYAWNDVEGWISFNCANNSSCDQTDYKVNTSWSAGRLNSFLESSIIDTGGENTLQSIVWQGSQPSGTKVEFRIAAATSTTGPWEYQGPSDETWFGASCESSPNGGATDTPAGPNTPICVDKSITNNKRYVRYKVRLQSNLLQDQTPTITNIILNWSK